MWIFDKWWPFGKSDAAVRMNYVTPAVLAQMLPGKTFVLDETHVKKSAAPAYPEAERIAQSLSDCPGDWAWHHKGYELKHVPTGFILWVANQDYGLKEVWANGGKSEFSKPEQAIIWPAVEGWLARNKVGFTGRLPKVKITGRAGTYWCVADGHVWAGAGGSPAEAYASWSRAISIQARKDSDPDYHLHVWSGPL